MNSAVQRLYFTYEVLYPYNQGVSVEYVSEGRRVVTPASTGIKGEIGVVLGTFAVYVTVTVQYVT
jgi:hypothetical protein